jgi:hypothetical protein
MDADGSLSPVRYFLTAVNVRGGELAHQRHVNYGNYCCGVLLKQCLFSSQVRAILLILGLLLMHNVYRLS